MHYLNNYKESLIGELKKLNYIFYPNLAPSNINAQNKLHGYTQLHTAIIDNKLDTIVLLLEYGANPNIQTNLGNTPLHIASHNGQSDIIKLLLQHKNINPNIKNKSDESPLHIALENQHRTIIELLLAHQNIDVNIKNNNGDTLLHIISLYKKIDITSLLLSHKNINLSIKNNNGETPLHRASYYERLQIAQLLLERGMNPNIKDQSGESPLHMALRERAYTIVKILLQYGASYKDLSDKSINRLPLGAKKLCHIASKDTFNQITSFLNFTPENFIKNFNKLEKKEDSIFLITQMILYNKKLTDKYIAKIYTTYKNNIPKTILFFLPQKTIDTIIETMATKQSFNTTQTKDQNRKEIIKDFFIKSCMASSPNFNYFLKKIYTNSNSYPEMQKTFKIAYQATHDPKIKQSITNIVRITKVNKQSQNRLTLTINNIRPHILLPKEIIEQIIDY